MVENYGEIEELLSAGEMRGRRWVFDQAQSPENAGKTPTDHDILDLHCVMFGDFLEWAGSPRREDRGPGGNVSVPWPEVRVALRNLSLDVAAWVGDMATVDTRGIANVIADVHHRFQWVHPFKDTNGRTGRGSPPAPPSVAFLSASAHPHAMLPSNSDKLHDDLIHELPSPIAYATTFDARKAARGWSR